LQYTLQGYPKHLSNLPLSRSRYYAVSSMIGREP
jgi:hypothetical protein